MAEYLLILALVSFLAVAGTRNLATGLDSAVTKISSIVGQYIGAGDDPGNSGGHGHHGHHGGHGGGNGNNGNHGNGNNGNHGNGNNGNGKGNSGN